MGGDFDIDWKDYTLKGAYDNEDERYIKIYAPSAIQAWIVALNHLNFKPREITRYYEHD